MGWYFEQIRQRRRRDQQSFEDAYAAIAGAVLGRGIADALGDERAKSRDAINRILRYYHVPPHENEEEAADIHERLERAMRPYGIMYRTARLEKGWHRGVLGAMLATRKSDGMPVALLPAGLSGYAFETENGKTVRVTRRNEGDFAEKAICFYKPFPMRKLNARALPEYMAHALSPNDIARFLLAALLATLCGMVFPRVNQYIYAFVIPSGNIPMLLSVSAFILCATVARAVLGSIQSFAITRVNAKVGAAVEAATMIRILSLPANFFRHLSAGELAKRAEAIETLCSAFMSSAFTTVITALFSLVYLAQIARFAPALASPAITVLLASLALSAATAFAQARLSQEKMDLSAKESGLHYAFIAGIQKIRLAGAEKRAFARWGELYASVARLSYHPPALIKLNAVMNLAITSAGVVALYGAAMRSGVPVADYCAFISAYGMVSGAFLSLSRAISAIAQIRPVLNTVRPILEATPEISEGKELISRLFGSVELSGVSFRYAQTAPNVVDNLSFKVHTGQYVAIVGETGCGKTTLMRLMLGFEAPQKGAVYYDGKDLSAIDPKSLRQKIGVVTQNGKLFPGSIYENIVASAPWLGVDAAWSAAELAGIAEDIRRMPMGMRTILSEGSGGISGGQKQRLMIARAIVVARQDFWQFRTGYLAISASVPLCVPPVTPRITLFCLHMTRIKFVLCQITRTI